MNIKDFFTRYKYYIILLIFGIVITKVVDYFSWIFGQFFGLNSLVLLRLFAPYVLIVFIYFFLQIIFKEKYSIQKSILIIFISIVRHTLQIFTVPNFQSPQ